jgi:hypothetical protein
MTIAGRVGLKRIRSWIGEDKNGKERSRGRSMDTSKIEGYGHTPAERSKSFLRSAPKMQIWGGAKS